MGFLHKLWDETLAGPTPETGLGKLRKYNTFSAAAAVTRSLPTVAEHDEVPITRSITILRTNSNNLRCTDFSDPSSSLPGSPSGSITPRTPSTAETPGGYFKKLTRRKSSKDSMEGAEYRSPTIYDWVVMSALDHC